jgi:hypothetical protein
VNRRRLAVIAVAGALAVAAGVLTVLHFDLIGFSAERTEPQPDMRDFQALPYLAHVEDDPNPEARGVILNQKALSSPGLNLLTSMKLGRSHLLDAEGNILHTWESNDSIGNDWLYAEMDTAGNLFVIVIGLGLVKMDWNSAVTWVSRASDNPYLGRAGAGYHHDLELAGSGDIYILAQELRDVDLDGGERGRGLRKIRRREPRKREIRDNSVVVMDHEGRPGRKMSIFDIVGRRMADGIMEYISERESQFRRMGVVKVCTDVFHSNTVEEIRMDMGVAGKGDLLTCIRNLDLIAVLDPEEEVLKWSWGPGVLEFPHNPSVVGDGNILIFDNGRRDRGYSRVLEIDPRKEEIVWNFEADPRRDFFSPVMGSSQRLGNGNTLITESTKGRVFEVTADRRTVWDFRNFEEAGTSEAQGRRSTIYRMVRYPPGYLRAVLLAKPGDSAHD